ncbi:receptor-like protein 6 [Rhodamnia argentea]|uniref:Receptor-like protein 6 n=1 Tax=Rhodamnia argentea TaxID=178133 RepID=A0ABM3GVM3_9MYRT|nr:receptor-like protein 6 [Rhodamnia argentea]
MNNFSGGLPSKYFDSWIAMKFDETDEVVYYADRMVQYAWFTSSYGDYDYSFTILNKGIEMEYNKILEYLTVIDLSSNGFIGEIPSSIGSLKELHLLNLSNNAIAGSIPSSLGNLTKLEALDLSSNELIGKIPPELTQLTSLAFFNASRNRLSGPIPREKQFNTFENSSYGGNLGLCGAPLTKKCGDLEAPPPPPSNDMLVKEGSRTSWIKELDWKIVLMGVASGSVVGTVMGLNYTTRIQHWFVVKFCRGKQRGRRHRRRVV